MEKAIANNNEVNELPPLFYTDKTQDFLFDVGDKKIARKKNNSLDKDQLKKINQVGVKSLTRISKLSAKEFMENQDILGYFKKKISPKRYTEGSRNNTDGFGEYSLSGASTHRGASIKYRESALMVYPEKLLSEMASTKSPNVRKIYKDGFKSLNNKLCDPLTFRNTSQKKFSLNSKFCKCQNNPSLNFL